MKERKGENEGERAREREQTEQVTQRHLSHLRSISSICHGRLLFHPRRHGLRLQPSKSSECFSTPALMRRYLLLIFPFPIAHFLSSNSLSLSHTLSRFLPIRESFPWLKGSMWLCSTLRTLTGGMGQPTASLGTSLRLMWRKSRQGILTSFLLSSKRKCFSSLCFLCFLFCSSPSQCGAS